MLALQVLNVTRTDVGEGWWEGEKSSYCWHCPVWRLEKPKENLRMLKCWGSYRNPAKWGDGPFSWSLCGRGPRRGSTSYGPSPPSTGSLFQSHRCITSDHLVLAGLQQPTACSSPQYFRHIQSCWGLEQVQMEFRMCACTLKTFSDPWAGVAGGMAPPQQQTNDWGAGADVSSHH